MSDPTFLACAPDRDGYYAIRGGQRVFVGGAQMIEEQRQRLREEVLAAQAKWAFKCLAARGLLDATP